MLEVFPKLFRPVYGVGGWIEDDVGGLRRRYIQLSPQSTLVVRTFATELGKLAEDDQRPSERTRFNEKAYPEAWSDFSTSFEHDKLSKA